MRNSLALGRFLWRVLIYTSPITVPIIILTDNNPPWGSVVIRNYTAAGVFFLLLGFVIFHWIIQNDD
jgi:hypothetical protein